MDKDLILILNVLSNSTLITIKELQDEAKSSKRQITYRVKKINDMLKVKSVPLISLGSYKDIIVPQETRKAI